MHQRFIIIILLLLFSFVKSSLFAQEIRKNNYGINGGFIIAFGNKFDRIGISVNAYIIKGNFQFNPEFRVYYNLKNLGPKEKHVEAQVALGVVYGYGKSSGVDTSYFFSSVSNQMKFRNSIGYSFNCYFNSIKTSQQTGIISLQFNQFSFITENDIFARPKLDRYRTGAFLFQFRKDRVQFGINSTLFTGQMGSKINDDKYPHNHTYKNTTGGNYPLLSHGLLSGQVQYILPYYQKSQINIGVDSERVRHVIQNRLIHDQIFLPKKWRKINSAHLPMIDSNGKQYLFKEDQRVKPPKFYYNIFSNHGLFY